MNKTRLPSAPTQEDAHSRAPPPAYAEAINYPTLNAQQPNSSYAHPQPNAGYPQQQFAAYHPPRPGGVVSPQIVVQQRVVLGQPCRFCRNGTVKEETDICCLVFLAILAFVTFPVGLVFLCCMGCTRRRRCVQCRRLH